MTSSGRAAGGGALGGVGPVTGTAAGAVGNTASNVGGVARGATDGAVSSTTAEASHGAIGGLNAAGQLRSDSQGVFGLHGLSLHSSGANSTEGSVITSTNRNVHLDSGTQMLLVAHGQASAGNTKP